MHNDLVKKKTTNQATEKGCVCVMYEVQIEALLAFMKKLKKKLLLFKGRAFLISSCI